MKTKVAIRKFPPGFTAEQFDALLAPWIASINYHYFKPGRSARILSSKPAVHGCGYANFTDPSVLLEASNALNGRRLVDGEGYEGVLEVSLAMSQLVPSPTRPDPLSGTYETESQLYREFLAEREVKPSAVPLDKQLETLIEREKELHPWKYSRDLVKQTPLLLHLKKQSPAPIETGRKKNKKKPKSKKKQATTSEQPAPPAKPAQQQQPKKPTVQYNTSKPLVLPAERPATVAVPKIMSRPRPEAPPTPANPKAPQGPVAGQKPAVMKRLPKTQTPSADVPDRPVAIHYSSSKGPGAKRSPA